MELNPYELRDVAVFADYLSSKHDPAEGTSFTVVAGLYDSNGDLLGTVQFSEDQGGYVLHPGC